MKIFFLLAAVSFSFSQIASAGSAQCGDVRKIVRGASIDNMEACNDPAVAATLKQQASGEAEAAALARLAKFDSECQALKGQVVTEDSEVTAHANYTAPEENCITGPHGTQHCVHSPARCSVDASASVTHQCACN